MGRVGRRSPVSHGLINGIIEGLLPRLHRYYFGPKGFHPQHVQLLSYTVQGSHVHRALQPKQRAHCSGGHAVLPGPGLCDHAPLAQPLGQHRLPQRVVDLVCPGVQEVLALVPDLCSHSWSTRLADVFCLLGGLIQKRRPPGVVLPIPPHIVPELSAVEDSEVLLLKIQQRRHQNLRHKLAPELTKVRRQFPLAQPHHRTNLPEVLHFVDLNT
mmetsp:Transcript_8311/g.16061  ORF Transcript_8311/g.16061 Transcript_8311/m.16061 type:complete len:213 (+) Transcript_8311:2785-3423(+)